MSAKVDGPSANVDGCLRQLRRKRCKVVELLVSKIETTDSGARARAMYRADDRVREPVPAVRPTAQATQLLADSEVVADEVLGRVVAGVRRRKCAVGNACGLRGRL